MPGSRRQFDLAYSCFLISALPTLAELMLMVIAQGSPSDPAISLIAIPLYISVIPLYLLAAGASVIGIWLTIRFWNQLSLVSLSAINIIYIVLLFDSDNDLPMSYRAVRVAGILAICALWLLDRRKRFAQAQVRT